VGLIDLDTEVVLDSLHGHVLAEGAEHVVYPLVVGLALLPLGLEQLEGLLEDGLRAHLSGVWRTREAVVVLLDGGVGTLDGEMAGHLIEVHAKGLLLYKIISLAVCNRVHQLGLDLSLQRQLLLKLFEPLQSLDHFLIGQLLLLADLGLAAAGRSRIFLEKTQTLGVPQCV
jgi:hypothetical protein